MTKSATDVMQEIIFAAVVDSLDALKSASRGVPNTLLRDIGAIHTNSTFADLPRELQATITASVRGAFNRLLKEGYSVAPRDAVQPPRPPRPDQPPRGPRGGPGGRPGGGPGGGPRGPGGGPGGQRRRPPPGAKTAPEVTTRKPKPRRP